MIARPVREITEADLLALVTNQTAESQTLDFKRDLPGRDSAAKHEFASDVCAFANTASGGDLVYGLDEDNQGQANAILPAAVNADEEQRRLLDIAMNGLEPRVPGVDVRAVPVAGGHVFVIRVPGSWQSPHRVRSNNQFYVREGARKRPLDVPEIRSAFLRSAGLAGQVRDFRTERVGKILAGDAPVTLAAGPIGVFHIVPVQLAEQRPAINPGMISGKDLPLISDGGSTWRINLDGYMRHEQFDRGGCRGYTLLFRDGRVEAVCIYREPEPERPGGSIPSTAMERYLLKFYDVMTKTMREMELNPPYALLFSLLRVKDAEFVFRKRHELTGGDGRFDRDVLLLPDTLVEDDRPRQRALRPLLDMVWQAAGDIMSPNFDESGEWKPR